MRHPARSASAPSAPAVLALLASCATLALVPAAARAARIVVTNTNDSFAGSLRQAIINSAPGDTVVFDPSLWGNSVALTSGAIGITQDVTILGPNPRLMAIVASSADRLFAVSSGHLTLQGIELGGSGSTLGIGGAMLWVNAAASLTLTDCALFDGATTAGGGQIENDGTATLLRCSFNAGGATGSSNGGAIANFGNLTATDCLFTGNAAFGAGGAMYCQGNMNLVRCTFEGNLAAVGGAVQCPGTPGLRAFYDCTIANNTASSSTGGIGNIGPAVILSNTIVAGNSKGDVSGAFDSHGYNAIGDATGSSGLGGQGSHDQVGTTANPFPAGLGPLADNGGPTPTMVPLPGSLVIDQGLSTSGPVDARGHARVYDNPAVANAAGGDGSDVGAVEAAPATHFQVTNLADHGAGSFRQAVITAGPTDSVTFRSDLYGTIALTGGEVFLPRSATVLGPGPNVLTIDGGGVRPVLYLDGLQSPVVTLSGLALARGATTAGLDIDNQVTLTADLLAITDCGTSAIRNLGVLTLSRSLLARCNAEKGTAQGSGGGLENSGQATLIECTVAADTGFSGGGIFNPSGNSLNVRNCTIANNVTSGTGVSSRLGGGILNAGSASLTTTLVAGNRADVFGPDLAGVYGSGGYNLVGVGDGSGGLTNGANQDQVGTGGAPIAAMLGPLADNGGPTLTLLPLAGSPAIDHGLATGLVTDQRLRARVFDDGAVTNAAGGDGSDVGAVERGAGTVDAGPPTGLAPVAVDRIDQVAPDPAVGAFRVRFTLARAGEADLTLFDVAGRRVARLAGGVLAAGPHEVAVDRGTGRIAAGVYWLRLAGPTGTSMRRVIWLR